MTSKIRYPKIMEPGQLRGLNDYVLSRLGTPIFFAVPEPARPRTQSAIGMLFESVTGLYLIYKDYGMRLFRTYLSFCKDEVEYRNENSTFALQHYYSVNELRGGFCHGSLPGGAHVKALLYQMDLYVQTTEKKVWPDFMMAMTVEQCRETVNKLSSNADRLMDYVKICADQIASNEELLGRWRRILVNRALNPDIPQYGYEGHKQYFDERVVKDLENEVKGGQMPKGHQETLKRWLSALKPELLNGKITDSDRLYHTLVQALEQLYYPVQTGRSSASLLLGDFTL